MFCLCINWNHNTPQGTYCISNVCMQERENIGGQRVWLGWESAVVVFSQLCTCVCVDHLHQDVCGHRCQPGSKVSLAGETGIKFLQWNVIWILLPPGDQRVAGHQWTVSGWKPLLLDFSRAAGLTLFHATPIDSPLPAGVSQRACAHVSSCADADKTQMLR